MDNGTRLAFVYDQAPPYRKTPIDRRAWTIETCGAPREADTTRDQLVHVINFFKSHATHIETLPIRSDSARKVKIYTI
jgi:hypothetical protein